MNQLGGRIVRYLYELGRGKAVIEAGQDTTRGRGCIVWKFTLRKSYQLEAITRSGPETGYKHRIQRLPKEGIHNWTWPICE